MLKEIAVKNYRSWADSGSVPLAPLTGFFGTNSSGKSSLLRFLLMLKQTAESRDRGIQLELGGPKDYVELGSPKDVIFDHNDKLELAWTLCWEGGEPCLPAVATGSHTDAIPNAGAYDGTVGVLGGIEALAALRRAGFQPRRSLKAHGW